MAKILIGITGSIAAIKTVSLIHILTQNGHQCKAIITSDGLHFVTPISLTAMGAEVFTDDLKSDASKTMEHIYLAKWAEYILIAPASASSIAKLAHGFADNLLMATILASPVKPVIIPAMNQQMWKNHFTQKNINALKEIGIKFWGPKSGLQACGDNDIGRMLEASEIYIKFDGMLPGKHPFESQLLSGLTIVITTGPTREAIDPVRYISNHSSGKMGYAIAEQAIKYGAKVILISGNVNIEPPQGLFKFITVQTADDMLAYAQATAGGCDIFIGCAAVCDYKVANYSLQKIKKSEEMFTLDLVANPDIISTIKTTHPNLFVVGFAAETEHVIDNAIIKLKKKNLDMIIANDVSNDVFDKDMNQIVIIHKSLHQVTSDYSEKKNISRLVLENIAHNFLHRNEKSGVL